jgi:hypothetical protein
VHRVRVPAETAFFFLDFSNNEYLWRIVNTDDNNIENNNAGANLLRKSAALRGESSHFSSDKAPTIIIIIYILNNCSDPWGDHPLFFLLANLAEISPVA